MSKIDILKKEFDRLKQGKEALLALIDEAEIAESVYNSNAIENSTLTLKETEKIIMEMEISRNISLREVFEAKNLARIFSFIKNDEKKQELTKDMILFFHKMLLENINDKIFICKFWEFFMSLERIYNISKDINLNLGFACSQSYPHG